MNILYINHYAGSIHHGMEYRPFYLAREWVKLGHQVTIVASSFSHLRSHNITILGRQNYLHENIDGIEYIWYKTPKYKGNGIYRLINIFTFLYRLKRLQSHLAKSYKPDLVIASSTYPLDCKIAATIAKSAGAQFIYEVHDLWPLTLIELNGMSRYHPLIWLMQRAENFAYQHAHKVVSLLPHADSYMQAHGMDASKFVYIPNGVSISDWQANIQNIPVQHAQTISELRKQHKFLLGYVGGMAEANALDYLLSAAKELLVQTHQASIAIILVGTGIKRDSLMARAKTENLSNVTFLPAVAKQQVPALLACMDGLFLGWHQLPIYRFGICPNKLFDYMLAAKPIIHAVSAANDLVADANCGISVEAANISAIVSAINSLANMPENSRMQLGINGREYVIKHHDYAHLAKNFCKC